MEAFDYLVRLTSHIGHSRDHDRVRHAHTAMAALNEDCRSEAAVVAPTSAWSVHAARPASAHCHRSFNLALSAFGL